jgi:hypothetical protein
MFDGPQPAAPVEPHPLEVALANEWNAVQLSTQHLADVLSKITAAWRQDRARIAELETRIAELEAPRATAEP